MAKEQVKEVKKKNNKKNDNPHPLKKTGQAERDKEKRRLQHEARVTRWQMLSPQEQLVLLDSRGVVAKKQRLRIQAKLEAKK